MTADQELLSGSTTIEISRTEAFAGNDFVLAARVTCDPPRDLRGQSVHIHDANGTVLAEARIVALDGASVNHTEEIKTKAPDSACEIRWLAVLAAHEIDGRSFPETSTPFNVTVMPHPVYMTVWDVPYAVNAGERFGFKVGVKCGAGCTLTHRRVVVVDEDDNQVAAAETAETPWSGTEGLYVAEFSAAAPETEGVCTWHAKFQEEDEGRPHDAVQYTFGVRAVPKAEVTVTIKAVSQEAGEPLAGARVVMHPYRAETDESGVARIRAVRGSYIIIVSKAKFDPMRTTVNLETDYHGKVALVREAPPFNPDDNY